MNKYLTKIASSLKTKKEKAQKNKKVSMDSLRAQFNKPPKLGNAKLKKVVQAKKKKS
jgi:hypothetical protein